MKSLLYRLLSFSLSTWVEEEGVRVSPLFKTPSTTIWYKNEKRAARGFFKKLSFAELGNLRPSAMSSPAHVGQVVVFKDEAKSTN